MPNWVRQLEGDVVSTSERGHWGEEIAVHALEARQYVIVERNWRCRAGEIDIVARDGETWVFIEVKLRQGEAHGLPEEAVTPSKQSRLLQAAEMYLDAHDLHDVPSRIDVVAISLGPSGKVHRLALYQDAVRADG
jgi:putative endonuclease